MQSEHVNDVMWSKGGIYTHGNPLDWAHLSYVVTDTPTVLGIHFSVMFCSYNYDQCQKMRKLNNAYVMPCVM